MSTTTNTLSTPLPPPRRGGRGRRKEIFKRNSRGEIMEKRSIRNPRVERGVFYVDTSKRKVKAKQNRYGIFEPKEATDFV